MILLNYSKNLFKPIKCPNNKKINVGENNLDNIKNCWCAGTFASLYHSELNF